MSTSEQVIADKYAAIAPFLAERQQRLWLAAEAQSLGHGGVSLVARATGRSRTTVTKAVAELSSRRVRRCRQGGYAVRVRGARR